MNQRLPPPAESEVNRSSRRRAWQGAHHDETTGRVLAEDARYFLHQAVSPPCLSAIHRAKGIWLEDMTGAAVHGFPRQ